MKLPHTRLLSGFYAFACFALLPFFAFAGQPDSVIANVQFEVFEFDSGGLNSPLLDGANLNLTIFGATSGNEVFFKVSNDSDLLNPNVSLTNPTITRIYFDDGLGLLSGGSIFGTKGTVAGEGVVMEFGAKPGNVPGGNNIGFDADISLGAIAPPSKNGIDPLEAITIGFDTVSMDAVVAAMITGDLRVALHVQEVGSHRCASAGFVNRSSVNAVPEPGSALLLLFAALCGMARRQRP